MKNIPTTILTQPTPVYQTPPSPPSITFPCPLSYEFQVVEYMTEDKVAKVELQYKINQHDQYGNTTLEGHWTPVPRIKLPLL
jgi:hypothetical protein